MSYVEGFVVAVPAAKKEAYAQYAAAGVPLFKEFGATRLVEAWGDDVPDGKITDFKGAVKAKPDEVVVFAWLEYPSKEARDAATEKMRTDPRAKAMSEGLPFDGQRMIYGGFAPLGDDKLGGPGQRPGNGKDSGKDSRKTGYIDGCLVPVPAANKQAYADMAARMSTLFKEYGATRVVDAWADDVPDGKITDFKGAVKATGDEKVVYSWIEWPSKEARDEGWKKVMADSRMHENKAPFDGQRMIYGGFTPIVDL
ncbi:hypothetical protein BH11PSE3_BH11PSE3_16930 [soil metagenome]